MSNETGIIYEFGKYRLDPGKRRLTCDGLPLPASQQSLLLLSLLVENAGRVVTLDEMADRLYEDKNTVDTSVESHLATLRRVLHEEGEKPLLRSIAGKGVRFEAPVSELLGSSVSDDIGLNNTPSPKKDQPDPRGGDHRATPWGRIVGITAGVVVATTLGVWGFHFAQASGGAKTNNTASEAASGGSQVAVLPFQAMGAGAADEKLAENLANSVASALSKKGIAVLPPTSATGGNIDSANGGQELNVRVLVRGMVQRIGGQIFVNMQVLSSQDGRTLWTGQLTGNSTDLPKLANSLSDKITQNIPDGQTADGH